MIIRKRDGRNVEYDQKKIELAICGAMNDIGCDRYDIAKRIAHDITQELNGRDSSVDEISEITQNKLMSSSLKDVAKQYIRYCWDRQKERERNSSFMKTISEKLSASNIKNQNANLDEASFGGRMGEANDTLMKKYALDYCVSKMAKENHLNNEIYIHDLSQYAIGSHNCLSIPFDKLLKNGFNTRQSDIRSANSINTAFQLIAVIFQLQSLQQFGGVSATHLDHTMVPYVRKSFYKHYKKGMKYIECKDFVDLHNVEDISIESDVYTINKKAYKYAMDMTIEESKQASEGMFHNLNTLQSRSGNQLPFSSINFGTCTLAEGRIITKSILEASISGVGKLHKTSIFPCSIFQVMKGVNKEEGTKNYDLYKLAMRSTAQRLYPNYVNCDWSGNAGYDKNDPKTYMSTMGECKLQLM